MFLLSLAYILYVVVLMVISANCTVSHGWCNIREDDPFGMIIFIFMPFLPMFFLSLITYKMKEEAFQAWFRFALWFVPIIMVMMYLLNGSGQSGMGISGAVSRSFDFLVISIFYVIFIVVSLIRVALAYKRAR